MSDGKFYEVMSALKTYLAARLSPMVNRVELYEGAYDDKGVMRMVSNAGVVHIAFLGAANVAEGPGGPATVYASYGAYLATSGNDRIRTALNRLEGIAVALINCGHDQDAGLGITHTLPVIVGSVENLYNADAGKQGVAIFGLSFAVPIILGEDVFKSDDDPLNPTKWFVNDGEADLFSFNDAEPQPPEEP